MKGWPLLAPLSFGYGAAVFARNLAFDRGLFPVFRPPVKVVSIGNLSAGGSGKTPVTIDIARRLSNQLGPGNVAVISRGYGRTTEGPQIVADFDTIRLGPREGGDEPVLIAENLPGVPVVVSERRAFGAVLAIHQFSPKVLVLDDAFQHRSIARDHDIVLLDETSPSWMWRLLPAGRLREPGRSLKRAHLVALTGGGNLKQMRKIRRWADRYGITCVVAGKLIPRCVRPLQGKLALPLHELRRVPVAAFCAIARPQRFFSTLDSIGAQVVLRHSWPDHSLPMPLYRKMLIGRARRAGAKAIVITAKDAVKWRNEEFDIPIWSLEMDWEWTHGLPYLERIIQEITSET